MNPARLVFLASCVLPKAFAGDPASPVATAHAPEAAPVLAFVWASDLHLDASRQDRVAQDLRAAEAAFAPDFFLFTGDNNAIPAPPRAGVPDEPVGLRRHRHLKAFLDSTLRVPAVVIPGDNWPAGFAEVFGPTQRRLDAAGLQILLLATDRACHAGGSEGLSVFDEGTWSWLRKELEACRGKPTILALHEPVFPPCFLDASPLRGLLRGHPDVLAVLQGHLHADLEFRADGRTYLVAPALGPGPRPALKRARVYAAEIRMETYAADAGTGRLVPQGGAQVIAIPRALRSGLVRPANGLSLVPHSAVPAHPHVEDPALASRAGELARGTPAFLETLLRWRPRR